MNKVRDRCTIHEGDNRLTCPSDVADRVNLGLIPSSEMSWDTACKALKSVSGGMLHTLPSLPWLFRMKKMPM